LSPCPRSAAPHAPSRQRPDDDSPGANCAHGGAFGDGEVDGGQGERVRAPHADATLVQVPGSGFTDEQVASFTALSDVRCTGYHADQQALGRPNKEFTMSETKNNEVSVLIGAGAIGQAIARRVAIGKTLLLADINEGAAKDVAATLAAFGFRTEATHVDVSSQSSVEALARKAAQLGDVKDVIHTAGLSPAQASAEAIIAVDLIGTALVLEAFGKAVARGGSGLVVASQAGYMLPPLPANQNEALAKTPANQIADLLFLQTKDMGSGAAYAIAKRANSLRVQAESVNWGDRGARLNSVSPGIIMTPLAQDELNGPGGEGYRRMIASSSAGRVGTPDEVGALGAFLMGPEATFISGSDILIDGGVIAAIATGRYEVRLT
jgi:NAD(P)-dependent dehydrogenase (short-subunit alcohol dehydrogenase family)